MPRPQDYTLFDYLYVPHLVLEATAGRDDVAIQPRFKGTLPRQMFVPLGPDVSGANWLKPIKSFTSRQIRLVITSPDPERHPCLRGPSKVLAEDGTACYFKANVFEPGFVRRMALGEGKPWVYKQIAAAIESKLLRPDIRICRLHGVVVDEDRDVLAHYVHVSKEELAKWDDDFESSYFDPGTYPDYSEVRKCCLEHLVGILVTYVENKGTLHELAAWSDYSNEQRRHWAAEVEGLVKELHAAGLVWGDAKPHNVLVDGENRLWLIDFDGGYTDGWVDQDKKES
jgi:serine/threonine protein kinase